MKRRLFLERVDTKEVHIAHVTGSVMVWEEGDWRPLGSGVSRLDTTGTYIIAPLVEILPLKPSLREARKWEGYNDKWHGLRARAALWDQQRYDYVTSCMGLLAQSWNFVLSWNRKLPQSIALVAIQHDVVDYQDPGHAPNWVEMLRDEFARQSKTVQPHQLSFWERIGKGEF